MAQDFSRLGFGLMRLPRCPEDNTRYDLNQVRSMVDAFLSAGMTYFDTAFVYDGGDSEKAVKEILTDRYPRDSYTLATKLNARYAKNEEEAKQQIFTSLERTGAGYFDYYLLHAIMRENIQLYEDYHLWDYVRELKEKGLIRHWGFSFHHEAAMLDRLLTEHPEAEFVQLQINYADWNNPSVQAKECYEIARKHNKPIIVMEPVKGGTLAAPPSKITDILNAGDSAASPSSWAIRFAASLPGVKTVLSGMSNMAQMEDNLSYMKDFSPLNQSEQEMIQKVQDVLLQIDSIPCTNCHYCTAGCPREIPIPDVFSCMNKNLLYENLTGARKQYMNETKDSGKASDCIACGQCEAVCPQHISIISRLQECAAVLEA